jgi:hypothetical protein
MTTFVPAITSCTQRRSAPKMKSAETKCDGPTNARSRLRGGLNPMNGNSGFGWLLVLIGLVIAGIGLIWVLLPNLPMLGRLPGDIVIERPNGRFYFPIVTCIVISVVLSLVTWLLRAVLR